MSDEPERHPMTWGEPFEVLPGTPRGVTNALKKIGPGWTWRLTLGRGVLVKRIAVEDARENDGLKTAPTPIPVDSIGLRLRHEDGRRAFASWFRREDTGKWQTDPDGAAFLWIEGRPPWFCDVTTLKAKVAAPPDPQLGEDELQQGAA